jgi:hypothetical protein
MKPSPISLAVLVVSLLLAPALLAQSPDSANQSAASSASAAEVPRLIKFSGTLLDAQDRPLAGPVGVTFALHAQQTGGAALWLETQNVTPDAHGSYTVLLGANSTNGVPAELFASGEARWLEVQVERQAEQPRILLVSVPYALKAKDAETLGGKPASAFLTTETLAGTGNSAGAAAASPASSAALPSSKTQTTPKKAASAPQPAVACTSVTSDGTATVNSIAMFTAPCAVQSSVITESGSNVGIGTAAPAVALDIVGNNAGLRLSGTGTHQVTVTGLSSGRLGQDFTGFFFSSDSNGKVIKFLTNNGSLNEWMRITSAGNVGIGTTTPGAKLEIAGGNLALPPTTASAGAITLGGAPFLHNFHATGNISNTFVGNSAGNMSASLTGVGNTGVGVHALLSAAAGSHNSAFGAQALQSNTLGSENAAFGLNALFSNTAGVNNSAFGNQSLATNTTGINNSAFGFDALAANATDGNSAFGASALQNNTTGANNNAFGAGALFANTTGCCNSAFGQSALSSNTTGAFNSAFGEGALQSNTTGGGNAAFGVNALTANATGGLNSAFGVSALLFNNTGGSNSAFGNSALNANTTGGSNAGFGGQTLQFNTTGVNNAAFGAGALGNLGTGNSNIAIGQGAGSNFNVAESNNIDIGNAGVAGESNTIRIGSTQTATFIAGISGVTTASATGTAVVVDSNGQLGAILSSRRYKDDIADMAGESDLLMKLRPVSFYYKPKLDPTHTRQYGLVAEEVAQVSPELVVFDKDGVPQTVRYHFVNAMLLNEVQKQRSTIARQQAEIQDLAARLAKLEALVSPAP